MSGLKHIAWNASRVVAHNGGAISRALYSAANLYRKAYKNLNYDMETNGEYYLLDRLAKSKVKTVFDVGANKGDYTRACLHRFPQAIVHAFEIAPPTFEKLSANVSTERAKLNNFGLSNTEGSFELNYNPSDDGSSSLVEGGVIHNGSWQKINVKVITGDEYCNSNGIGQIDLLKIDVEGAEHLVLGGLARQFEKENISSVQFEFGMVNIYSKFLLKDFWDIFSKYGFILGPVMPKGVEFKEYNTRDEDFQGPPNFFAVHKSKANIIEAVKR